MKEQIVSIVAEYKGVSPEDIDCTKTFTELELDSLDVAELAMQIEDACNVTIDITPEMNSIDKLVAALEA